MRNHAKGRNRPLWLESLEERTLPSVTPTAIDLSGLYVDSRTYNPSDILVQFRTDALVPQSLLPGTTVGQKLDLVDGLFEVNLSPNVTVEQALAAYRASSLVESAEPDYALTIQGAPNDPGFTQQWALNNTGQTGGTPGADIDALKAWTVTTGSRKVVVAVMDTGIDYNHPDLYENIWLNQAEIPKSRLNNLIDVDGDSLITFADLNDPRNQGVGKITDVNQDGRIDAGDVLAPMVINAQGKDSGTGGWSYEGNTQDGDTAHPNNFVGWNFVNNTNNPFDDNPHGTHVAGIIGAMNNNGVGVSGVAPQVSLMAVKFLDANGHGSISAFIAGLNYSLAHGAKISNNSWSGAGSSQILSDAINNARSQGQIFVAAASNGSVNTDITPAYPSGFNLDNIVSVAASDASDQLAGFSAYGARSVALAAPGADIFSTLPGNTYESWSGTSMAAPQVAGVMALVWAKNPTWTYRQVIDQVLNTVDVLPAFQGKTLSGGRLNAAAAVGYQAPVVVAPQILGSLPRGPLQNTLSTVRLTFSKSINPATLTSAAVTLTGPTGQRIAISSIQLVANSGGKQFDVSFATQTSGGAYLLTVGSAVRDTDGIALLPYRATYSLLNISTFTTTQWAVIPDLGKVGSPITVNQDLKIGQVQVQLSIVHPYDSDLYIHLTSPSGTDILLSNRRGGSGDNYTNTLFRDDAPTPIRTGTATFTGSFQPESALSSLNGENARGVWRLWVEDRATGDIGYITSWSLMITGTGASGTAVTQSLPVGPVPGTSSPLRAVAPQRLAPATITEPVAGLEPTVVESGDVWRVLNAGAGPANTPLLAVAVSAPTWNYRVADQVFVVPVLSDEMRATAWLSRLAGGDGDEVVAIDEIGKQENGERVD